MNLYVWEDVLVDYSGGMICALAPSLKAAIAYAKRRPEFGPSVSRDMAGQAPQVVTLEGCKPKRTRVWAVYGGG